MGVIGWGVPIEMIDALGAEHHRFLPTRDGATPLADEFVGKGESRETRNLVDQVLGGAARDCALLVITRAHEWVYYFLKEAVRVGVAPEGLPTLHLLDLIASTDEVLREYNLDQLKRLESAIGREMGVGIGPSDWERAFAASNDRMANYRALAEARAQGSIMGTPSVRLAVHAVNWSSEKFADEAQSLIAGASDESDRPRILLLASDDDEDGAVHSVIEGAGAIVIAEDGEWGIRTAKPDIQTVGEPCSLLLDRLLETASGHAVSPRDHRLRWSMQALADEAIDAVIFAVAPDDQRFGWDYPLLRDRADALGRPQFLLRYDVRRDSAGATSEVAEFLSSLDRRNRT